MTNLRQAAQQALEALKGVLDDNPKVLEASISGGLYEVIQCRDAITALRTALEQKQAEPVCPNCKAAVLYECVACSSNNYPPKRPWVGLTEEDLDYLCHLAYTGDEEFALTVQAKLKELNT